MFGLNIHKEGAVFNQGEKEGEREREREKELQESEISLLTLGRDLEGGGRRMNGSPHPLEIHKLSWIRSRLETGLDKEQGMRIIQKG